jgi:tetratricopeptide (TPR) repeat protein
MENKEDQVTESTETYREQAAELTATARGYLAKGDWEPAIEAYNAVIGLMDGAGDVAGKAEAVNNIASVYLALMNWEEALSRASEARDFYRQIGDGAGEAVVLNNIAAAHDGMGDWQKALDIYEGALTIRQSLDDAEGEAKTLRNQAIIFAQHGDRNRAKAYLNRALGAARRSKSHPVLAEIRKTMSQLPRLGRR